MISFFHSFHSKKAINPVSSSEESSIQGWLFICLFCFICKFSITVFTCMYMHIEIILYMFVIVPLFNLVFMFTTMYDVMVVK